MEQDALALLDDAANIAEAESILAGLANVFLQPSSGAGNGAQHQAALPNQATLPNMEARYKVLLDQIPAVVFMAYLDEGIG